MSIHTCVRVKKFSTLLQIKTKQRNRLDFEDDQQGQVFFQAFFIIDSSYLEREWKIPPKMLCLSPGNNESRHNL